MTFGKLHVGDLGTWRSSVDYRDNYILILKVSWISKLTLAITYYDFGRDEAFARMTISPLDLIDMTVIRGGQKIWISEVAG